MSINNVVVAFGGISPEHEVSVLTAHQAIAALRESGKKVTPLYVAKNGRWYTGDILLKLDRFTDLQQLLRDAVPCTISRNSDGLPVLLETAPRGFFSKPQEHPVYAMLLAFHGSDGENGAFQGLCEVFNIPYTGSSVLGSAIGMDKAIAKRLARQADIPVVDWVEFSEHDWVKSKESVLHQIEALQFPVFVKPVRLGSSIGISRAVNTDELLYGIELALRYDVQVLVEKAVSPLVEINCSVMGSADSATASVCEQPRGKGDSLSYEDKYLSVPSSSKGMASADRLIPAPIGEQATERIQAMALNIFKTLKMSGLVRIDFLMNEETGEVYFNEINSIPGSFSFYLWQHSGVSFSKVLENLLSISAAEQRLRNGRIRSYETNLLSKKASGGLKGLKWGKK